MGVGGRVAGTGGGGGGEGKEDGKGGGRARKIPVNGGVNPVNDARVIQW